MSDAKGAIIAAIITGMLGFAASLITYNAGQSNMEEKLYEDIKMYQSQIAEIQIEKSSLINQINDLEGRANSQNEIISELNKQLDDLNKKLNDANMNGNSKTPISSQVINKTLLSSITPLEKTSGVHLWDVGKTDNWGNKYMSGYAFPFSPWDGAYVTFVLDGKYTHLTVTLTPYETSDNANKIAFYSLSDLGTKKLFETSEITNITKPITETIDVSGVDVLMISNSSAYTVSVAIVDAYLE